MAKNVILAAIGGIVYGGIEIFWRGYTHWTMVVIGGLLFLWIGKLNENLEWNQPIWFQSIVATIGVTIAELLCGIVLNIILGLNVWDYSHLPGNVMGQICPQYSALWFPLSIVAIVVDDWLRYFLFKEERPKYRLW